MSAATVTLRPRTPGDTELLRRIYHASRDYEMGLVPWTEEMKEAFLDDQFRLQTAHYDTHYHGAQFHIIQLDGEPMGRLYLHETARAVYLMDITLLREYRNRGIGGELMKSVITTAHAAGRSVTCHVEVNNPAHRLYHRLGFQKIGDAGAYYELELPPI